VCAAGPQPPAVDRTPGLPDWFQTMGRGAWLLVGIAVLLAIAFSLLGLISALLIPLAFAAILAAIFVPLVDRLRTFSE
jgi:predicted PurR-regulated permease PerM